MLWQYMDLLCFFSARPLSMDSDGLENQHIVLEVELDWVYG